MIKLRPQSASLVVVGELTWSGRTTYMFSFMPFRCVLRDWEGLSLLQVVNEVFLIKHVETEGDFYS